MLKTCVKRIKQRWKPTENIYVDIDSCRKSTKKRTTMLEKTGAMIGDLITTLVFFRACVSGSAAELIIMSLLSAENKEISGFMPYARNFHAALHCSGFHKANSCTREGELDS